MTVRFIPPITRATDGQVSAVEINRAFGNFFQYGSYTGSLTGCTTVPTVQIFFRKLGDVVVLRVEAQTGTSNANTFTITGAPSAITPTGTAEWMVLPQFTDNSVSENAGNVAVQMNSSGILVFARADSIIGFTNTGTKGIENPFVYVYMIR